MTRENLLQAIYDNMDNWSCQSDCPHTMEEENPQEVCMECANNLLAEYEKQIRADAIDDFANALIDYIVNEEAKGNSPYWAVAIHKVSEQLKGRIGNE